MRKGKYKFDTYQEYLDFIAKIPGGQSYATNCCVPKGTFEVVLVANGHRNKDDNLLDKLFGNWEEGE